MLTSSSGIPPSETDVSEPGANIPRGTGPLYKAASGTARYKFVIVPVSPISKRWLALSTASELAALSDTLSTIHFRKITGGKTENDPLARPFVSLPTGGYIAVTAVLSGGLGTLSHRMENSHNHVVRKLWWLPQAVQIGVNMESAIDNERKLSLYRYQQRVYTVPSPE